VDLSEDMPDFTEDLISVVEEEDEKPQADEDSLDDLISEDLEIDEEAQLELETEQLEVDEPQIDIEKVEEEQDEEFDVSNLDVDFAEEVSTVPAPEPEKPQPEPKEEKTGAKSVLVIDDSIVIRKMVEIALEDENFKIVTAVSGKDGLALLDEKNPDLIILDLMLPDINGIDLLKTVKASKGIPVIMLSGKDSPQMVEKARAEGADAFLPKPFKDDELVEKIKELIS
jgi:CheY-like chemotaxis protein